MTIPELVADAQCQLAENPLWHPMEKRLYWTDGHGKKLFRYDPATGEHEECFSGRQVGGFTIQADGGLLLFMDRGSIATWREGKLNYVVEEIPAEHEHFFNDVIADPHGRVFCGTVSMSFGPATGRLYRLDTDGSLHVILDDIECSNGLAFSRDLKRMYYTDSFRFTIYEFDYDAATGALTRQRVWLTTPEDKGYPDGMTVDAEGYVWSARWNDWAIYRFAPDGREVERIELPTKKVSSVTFGGDAMEDLYVTTACFNGTRAELGEGAGALFRLRTGIRGVPEFLSRIKI